MGAIKAAELVDIDWRRPFILPILTNEAFAALPEGTVDTLFKPENLKTLQTVLTCHVVAAKAMAADVVKMISDNGGEQEIGTVGECKLTAKFADDKVTSTDENGNVATITIADVPSKNGAIHVIDTVLLRKS